MLLRARLGLIATVLSLLAACGGGGGGGTGNSPTPPVSQQPPPSPAPAPTPDPNPPAPAPAPDPTPAPTSTAEDAANARSSQLQMIQRAYGQQLVITWVDSFTAESGYRIEARTAGGTWHTVESLHASPGTGSAYQWHRVLDVSKNYRVSAVKDGYTVPLETAAGQSEIPIELASGSLNLGVLDAEPLSGSATIVSGSNTNAIQSITYHVDGVVVGTGTANTGFAVEWDTTIWPDVRYSVLGRATKTTGAILEDREFALVDNPGLAAVLNVGYSDGPGRELVLNVLATSDAGIESVQFLVNDNPLQTLVAPGLDGRYSIGLGSAQVPAGASTFKAIARDNNGVTVVATRQMTAGNPPPTLTLQAPWQGEITSQSGGLNVAGTFGDDRPGATLTVTLGDTQVLQTSAAGTFAVNHSIAGLAEGEYTLTARVVDADGGQTVTHRNVVVQTLVRAPSTPVGTGVAILAVEEASLLYQTVSGQVMRRDHLGNYNMLNIPAGLSQFASWGMNGGYTVMRATSPGPSSDTHIYLFDLNGVAINVSQQFGASINTSPILRNSWLVWTSGSGETAQYEIYNIDTQAHVSVPRPAGTLALGNLVYDFVTTPGAEQLFFWAIISGSGSAAQSEIFRYDLASATTHAVTTGGGLKHRYIETDNQRIAWRTHLGNGVFRIFTAPVANPTDITTVSSTAAWFTLRDGQLAWTESNGDGTSVLKVNDGTTTTMISSAISSTDSVLPPACVSLGQITFAENGTVQMWDSIRGKQTLLKTLPTYGLIHDADVAFYATGTESLSLYRLDLP